jgi:hypothetical protein
MSELPRPWQEGCASLVGTAAIEPPPLTNNCQASCGRRGAVIVNIPTHRMSLRVLLCERCAIPFNRVGV